MVPSHHHANAKLELLKGSGEGDCRDPRRPVIARSVEVGRPHQILGHSHYRGQLLYTDEAELLVATRSRRWLLTPQYALWIAPGEWHAVISEKRVNYRTAFLSPRAVTGIFKGTGAYRVPKPFRDLLVLSAEADEGTSSESQPSSIKKHLLNGFKSIQPSDYCITLPQQKTLRTIAEQLIREPDQSHKVRHISQQAGLSERHVLRLFEKETGYNFRQWRERLLVTLTLSRMEQGHSLSRIAQDLGYGSQAAFGTMFKRVTGASPKRYSYGTI